MQFVEVAHYIEGGRIKGFSLNADRYLERLPELAPQLPEGARRFAIDPDHYDFFSARCVKDLALVSTLDVAEAVLTLRFRPNEWKHDGGLQVVYRGVETCVFEPRAESLKFGTVMLDELLPSEHGVSHEYFMTGGTLRVAAEDLDATWSD